MRPPWALVSHGCLEVARPIRRERTGPRLVAWRIAVPLEKDSEALWAAITRFNLFPGEYWHDSWREQLTARIGPDDPDLSSQPLWVRARSTTILRELRLHDR